MKVFSLLLAGLLVGVPAFAQVGLSVSDMAQGRFVEDVLETVRSSTQLVEGEAYRGSLAYSNSLVLESARIDGEGVFITVFSKLNHADITISIDGVPVANEFNEIKGYYLGHKHDLLGKTVEIYSRNSKIYSMAGETSDLVVRLGSKKHPQELVFGYRMVNEELINRYKIKVELK